MTMRQQYGLLCLVVLVLFFTGAQTQDSTTTPSGTEWSGDPRLCTVNPPLTPSPQPAPAFPRFSSRAEFTLERVETKSLLNVTLPKELTLYQYLYDYNANTIIIVKNKNGFIDVEYYYYSKMKKSTYYAGQYCVVTDIPQNQDMDGASGIQLPDGSWHVRPLNEFLLFSSDNPSRPVTPVYLGKGEVRGIPVEKWQSCYIDKANFRTVRRIWSFAQRNVETSSGVVGDNAYPVEALISASYDFPNGSQIAEVDEVFSVLSYRPYILETAAQLSPPKGVFCSSGQGQQLISLSEAGIGWPNRFSVRVEASTGRTARWQSFHLRYDSGRDGSSRRLRYDYMPPGAEDYRSVIHDYANDVTYTIDQNQGSCRINRSVAFPDVSPIRDPIEFFIKHEAHFIFDPPQKAWEYNGIRSCRGNTIMCEIVTTSMDKFPAIVDVDTGRPTGETWEATNIEYAWSKRAPFASPMFNRSQQFDYPVSLYLKLFRLEIPGVISPENIRSEDIEYEFYEMSRERHPYDFDISICYRSLGYEYLHLAFVLKANRNNIVDNNGLDRRELEGYLYFVIRNKTEISFSRISGIEVDHERVSNELTVFFTLLGRTPYTYNDEISAVDARDKLKTSIDRDQFFFDFRLADNSSVQFRAQTGSLKSSKQYMSTHAAGAAVRTESYSAGAETLAIIVGLLIGLVVGAILAAVFRIARKEPMPTTLSIRNPIPTINFHSKKTNTAAAPTSDA